MGSACDHIDHTKTQLFYAISVAAVSIVFGYIPAGMGFSPLIVLPVGLLAIFALVRFVGRKV
jgi:Na+/H+ antiporter NhaC